jgi:hypothetical protein
MCSIEQINICCGIPDVVDSECWGLGLEMWFLEKIRSLTPRSGAGESRGCHEGDGMGAIAVVLAKGSAGKCTQHVEVSQDRNGMWIGKCLCR